jgi:hypothetical protein
MNEDKVSNFHPLYDSLARMRAIVKDVRSGTLALRAAKDKYLPKFPEEMQATYENRAKCSTLFNLYAKTEAVMTGLVFQNEIELTTTPQIKALAENIDNRGNHINIFARKTFENLFDGAAVILVDAPDFKDVQSMEDEQMLGLRPYWINYTASDVINWQFRINPVSRSKELTLIVFKEVTSELVGRFTFKNVTRYRVWFLNENNKVAWEVWREYKEQNQLETVLKMEASGVVDKVSAIPIVIIGDLEAAPPMLDIALLNVKHFQKESNFDNLEFQAAVPLFYTKGLEKQAGQTLPVGADIHYELSENGEVGWAQLDAGGFESLRMSLDKLVDQMAMLGLSMLTDKTAKVDVTATEVLLNSIGETAELRVMAESLKDGLESSLVFTDEYLGGDGTNGGTVKLGTAWTKVEMSAGTGGAMMPENEPAQEMVN